MGSIEDFGPQLIQLFKEEALDLLDQWESACLSLQSGRDTDAWNKLFASVHSLKGSIQTLGLHTFADYLIDIENFMSKSSAATVSNAQLAALLTAQTHSVVWVSTVEKLTDSDISSAAESIRKVLCSKDAVDTEKNLSASRDSEEKEHHTDRHGTLTKAPVAGEREVNEDVRVSRKLVDMFLDQLTEIQTHQKILETYLLYGNTSKEIANQSLILSQTRIRDLQRKVTDLRSVTAETVYKRLKRAVAEANLVLGKNVQLRFSGQLIKLDKTIVDQIVAPLVHLVKNCVDHGIESAEERIRCKKEAEGRVDVSVSRHAKNIEFIIKDDGKGINVQAVLKKAFAGGIITSMPEEAEIDDEQLLQLLCEPGFSTSNSVTEVSGRGVGMNAVVEKINSIGGSLTMESSPNSGTKFTVVVPNSFTSLRAIVVKINNFKIAIPMNEVNEVCSIEENTLECTLGEMKLEHKSDIIQYMHLDTLFSSTHPPSSAKRQLFGLISGKGHKKYAYGVDFIVGQQEVVVRPLDEGLTNLPGCQGAAYFSDGSPGIVMSLNKLLQKDTVGNFH